MRMPIRSLASLNGLWIWHCCHELWYIGHRHGSDATLLWLWYRPSAIALIQPRVWEPAYAARVALKRPKQKNKKNKTKTHTHTKDTEHRGSSEHCRAGGSRCWVSCQLPAESTAAHTSWHQALAPGATVAATQHQFS